MQTWALHNISKPKSFTDGTIKWPSQHALHVTTPSPSMEESTSFTLASKQPEWRHAMNEEFDALLQNGMWDLVPSSPTMNIIGCKWVFRIKHRADGSIERHKAWLVAKGFHQQPGLDYGEAFSPVVKPVTICTILSLTMAHGWSIRQLDIKNAFLHGLLDEPILMQQPPGFSHPQMPSHVCRLHKALYGLKQAPHAWFARLSSQLNELGFLPSKSDSSLFILHTPHLTCFVLIYMDDIIVTCSDSSAITSFIS